MALSFVTKSFSMSSVSARREAARVSKETVTWLARDRTRGLGWEGSGEAAAERRAARVWRRPYCLSGSGSGLWHVTRRDAARGGQWRSSEQRAASVILSQLSSLPL